VNNQTNVYSSYLFVNTLNVCHNGKTAQTRDS